MGINRRVMLEAPTLDGVPVARASGVAGEEFETELFAPYGLASGRSGEAPVITFNGTADNHVALAPRGDRVAEKDTVLIYYGEDTQIELSESRIVIKVPDGQLTIGDGKIQTDMDIITSGDVLAGSISLKRHKHSGVTSGASISGVSVP